MRPQSVLIARCTMISRCRPRIVHIPGHSSGRTGTTLIGGLVAVAYGYSKPGWSLTVIESVIWRSFPDVQGIPREAVDDLPRFDGARLGVASLAAQIGIPGSRPADLRASGGTYVVWPARHRRVASFVAGDALHFEVALGESQRRAGYFSRIRSTITVARLSMASTGPGLPKFSGWGSL